MQKKGITAKAGLTGRRSRHRRTLGPLATTRAITFVAALAGAIAAACDDPTLPLEPPGDLDRAMALLLVLNPDFTFQPLYVEAADVLGDPGFESRIDGVVATVTVQGRTILRVEPDTATLAGSCGVYGGITYNGENACIALDFQPDPGETYTITVTAPDRPTATATVRVPGHTHILEYDAEGSPPGTEGLSARWSPSAGAHRYFVALRSENVVCYNIRGCLDGWYATTTRPKLETVVPAEALDAGSGPWTLDIYALDGALYEYLTSGTGGEFFAVPPVSNVEGGYGVVGAWVRQSRPLAP